VSIAGQGTEPGVDRRRGRLGQPLRLDGGPLHHGAVRADEPASGEVTTVSLSPTAGKAEVVIGIHGAVQVRDFMLTSPDRLVLDVVGARLNQTAAALYDGVKRGGVLNLRYSQFRPDVVRIVLDPGLAHEKLGWQAAMPLHEGLARTYKFFSAGAP